jgi:hypothetical protein
MANTNSLLDRLRNQGGSEFSTDNGAIAEPSINPGATKQSKLHAHDIQPGYSLDGNFRSTVNQAYSEYDDGVVNALPQPSQIDLNGVNPSTPNRLAGTAIINNTFSEGTYKDSAPPEAMGRI